MGKLATIAITVNIFFGTVRSKAKNGMDKTKMTLQVDKWE